MPVAVGRVDDPAQRIAPDQDEDRGDMVVALLDELARLIGTSGEGGAD